VRPEEVKFSLKRGIVAVILGILRYAGEESAGGVEHGLAELRYNITGPWSSHPDWYE